MPPFDIDPSTDPLLIRKALGLPPLTPPFLATGRQIPVSVPTFPRQDSGLRPATLDASAAPSMPTVSGNTPPLNPSTLAAPDPNDPRYQLHGAKKFGIGLMGALAGLGGHLDAARELNPYQRAMDTYNRNLTTEKEQASIEDVRSQTAEREAQARRADAAANRPDKPATPEEATINDLMTGENGGPRVNPDTGKPYSYLEAYKATKQAGEKPEKTPESEKLLSDGEISQINAGNLRRHQVNNPGQQLPADAVLQKGATQKDADRIEKMFSGTEGAQATKAQRDQTEQDRKTARDQAEENRKTAQEQKALTERDKFVQPHKQVVDTVSDVADYVNGGKRTGPGDYAFMNQFQEMIVAGQKAGIRFTQNEQTMLRNAQSWANSVRSSVKHAFSPSAPYFSDVQAKQMLDVMQTISKRSQKQIDDYDSEHSGKAASRSGGTTKFTEGEKVYNIPNDQIGAFKKDHPNAR